MDREYSRDPAWTPEVVVVGAAARDIAEDDPRGWRLGGGVTYSALTTARLGLRTAALIGVDDEAATATELDLLAIRGAEIQLVPSPAARSSATVERHQGRIACRSNGSWCRGHRRGLDPGPGRRRAARRVGGRAAAAAIGGARLAGPARRTPCRRWVGCRPVPNPILPVPTSSARPRRPPGRRRAGDLCRLLRSGPRSPDSRRRRRARRRGDRRWPVGLRRFDASRRMTARRPDRRRRRLRRRARNVDRARPRVGGGGGDVHRERDAPATGARWPARSTRTSTTSGPGGTGWPRIRACRSSAADAYWAVQPPSTWPARCATRRAEARASVSRPMRRRRRRSRRCSSASRRLAGRPMARACSTMPSARRVASSAPAGSRRRCSRVLATSTQATAAWAPPPRAMSCHASSASSGRPTRRSNRARSATRRSRSGAGLEGLGRRPAAPAEAGERARQRRLPLVGDRLASAEPSSARVVRIDDQLAARRAAAAPASAASRQASASSWRRSCAKAPRESGEVARRCRRCAPSASP